jgi:autophagy-related protein 17
MVTPSPISRAEQPHLVSLVLQSKKALQHGEQLCSRAHVASNASAQCAVDVISLDAKVKWITDAVLEQLKVRNMYLHSSQSYALQPDI